MTGATKGPTRWGFLGAGFIASKALAPATHAAVGATLYAVASRDTRRAEKLEPTRTHGAYREVIEDENVDAVYIALSNDEHLPWTIAALEAGKAVLCEKPLTLDGEQCRHAMSVARSTGCLLVEATWLRWHPRYRRANELLGGERSGPISAIDAAFTFNGVPHDNYRMDHSKGGGALLDLGPYVLAPVVDWCHDSWQETEANVRTNDRGADLHTSVSLMSAQTSARLLTSFVDPPNQSLRVASRDLIVEWTDEAFTSWQSESRLDLKSSETTWQETFAPCDAYQLMVEQVSRRVQGDDTAHIPDSSVTLRTADMIDVIRASARRRPA